MPFWSLFHFKSLNLPYNLILEDIFKNPGRSEISIWEYFIKSLGLDFIDQIATS